MIKRSAFISPPTGAEPHRRAAMATRAEILYQVGTRVRVGGLPVLNSEERPPRRGRMSGSEQRQHPIARQHVAGRIGGDRRRIRARAVG
jgi:hypothetical protein